MFFQVDEKSKIHGGNLVAAVLKVFLTSEFPPQVEFLFNFLKYLTVIFPISLSFPFLIILALG